jgi:hypothetical protein
VIKHIAGDKNDAKIFTKNVTSAIFNKHVPLYVGTDKYVSARSLKFSQTRRGEAHPRLTSQDSHNDAIVESKS